MDLIMIAIDSFLVMFEECVQGGGSAANQTMSHDGKPQSNQQAAYDSSGKKQKRTSQVAPFQHANLPLTERDLATMLTRCGLLPRLAKLIPKLIEHAESSTVLKEQSNAQMYLERTFDIFQNLTISGQFEVRKELCSSAVMSDNLCRAVAATLSEPSSMTFQVTKWFSKILQALTSQQDVSSQQIYSNQHIFECLGEQNVICLLTDMLRFYLNMGDHMYLASIYDTLKLLNLLCKMSPARSE